MKAMTRRSRTVVATCLTVMAVGGFALAQTTALRIGVSSSGSIFYTLGVGLSTMLTKHANIAATAEPVGGSTANMFALGANKVDLAIANAGAAYDASHGNKPFKKKIDIGLIAQGAPNIRQIIVRVGSGIERPEDLVGKTIIGKRPALSELALITDALLKVYNIDASKVRIVTTTNTGEAVKAIKSDTVDAVVIPGSRGASYLKSLARDGKIKFLAIPDDKIKAMAAMLPKSISLAKLPANTYVGQDKPVNVFAFATYLVAASRLSDDTVYAVTKTLFDNIKQFQTYHATAKQWTLEKTLGEPKIPYHPGAIRYFKEKKLWTPELENNQAALKS